MSFLCCCRVRNKERNDNGYTTSTDIRMTISRHLNSFIQSQSGIADIDGAIEKWESAITNYADVC